MALFYIKIWITGFEQAFLKFIIVTVFLHQGIFALSWMHHVSEAESLTWFQQGLAVRAYIQADQIKIHSRHEFQPEQTFDFALISL